MPYNKTPLILGDMASLLIGVILPFAFAPLYWFWLAPLCIAMLLPCWINLSPRRALWRGLLFGLGFYGMGISWIFIPFYRFGHLGVFLSVLITILLILSIAVFFALQAYYFTKFFPKNTLTKFLLGFPALWVLSEWLRDWMFTGFPWLFLGYSQTNSPLAGYASIFGVYGTSFMVVLSGILLAFIFIPSLKRYLKSIYGIVLFILIWAAGYGLHQIQWTQKMNSSVKISLIQGAIPQHLKWRPKQIPLTLKRYQNLTNQHLDSNIIIWPECAVPLVLQDAKLWLARLDKKAKQHHATIILGIPAYTFNDKYYNAVIAIGKGSGTYYKRHLVPFGEYVPFENWLKGFLHVINAPMSDFVAGLPEQKLLLAGHIRLGTYLCYEIAYAELVRSDLPEANILVTMTNDAWFGRSWESAQHLQIGQMRSIESGRFSAFSTNTGITAVIAPNGKILKQLRQFKPGVLTTTIHTMEGRTPWLILGTTPIIFGCFLLLLIAIFRQKH